VKEGDGSGDGRTLVAALARALTPDWHEVRLAGRVERGTEILRGLAHEISADPDRPDRPSDSTEAQARLDAYIAKLSAEVPRHGLGAATGHFVDHLAELNERYKGHLFVCFDDPRVPPNTNKLEGFFGRAKRPLRKACGTGSTANSVAQNVGGDYLAAFALAEKNDRSLVPDKLDASFLERFREARARIAAAEAPTTRRRSLVRSFEKHVARLRAARGLASPDG
jgi:hypothetical protein